MRPVTDAERALISLVWSFRTANKKLRAYAQENANPELLQLIDEYIVAPLWLPDFDGVEETFMAVWDYEKHQRDEAVAEIMHNLGMEPL